MNGKDNLQVRFKGVQVRRRAEPPIFPRRVYGDTLPLLDDRETQTPIGPVVYSPVFGYLLFCMRSFRHHIDTVSPLAAEEHR
jgi:hypothetical protein